LSVKVTGRRVFQRRQARTRRLRCRQRTRVTAGACVARQPVVGSAAIGAAVVGAAIGAAVVGVAIGAAPEAGSDIFGARTRGSTGTLDDMGAFQEKQMRCHDTRTRGAGSAGPHPSA
jgi:hypothetical protein